MAEINFESFGSYFRFLRLKAGIITLSDLTNIFAERGYAFEESIFSHWQHDRKIPKDRKLLLTLLKVLSSSGRITSGEMNTLLSLAGHGYLTEKEESLFKPHTLFNRTIPLIWYRQMAQQMIIEFESYTQGDVRLYKQVEQKYITLSVLLEKCILGDFWEEVNFLWSIIRHFLWENAFWSEYDLFLSKIESRLDVSATPVEIKIGYAQDRIELYFWKKKYAKAEELLTQLKLNEDILRDKELEAKYYIQRAIVESHKKNLKDAIRFFTKAIEVYQHLKNEHMECHVGLYLGNAYEGNSEYQKAEKNYKKYLRLASTIKHPEYIASLKFHLATIYAKQNKTNEVIDYLKESYDEQDSLRALGGLGWRERLGSTAIQVCLEYIADIQVQDIGM